MVLQNKLIKSLLPIMLLFCAGDALALSFGFSRIKVEDGMVVPWKEIKEVILKPSDNAFDSSSFVVEDFRFLPIPDGKAVPDNIPLSFLAVASLMERKVNSNCLELLSMKSLEFPEKPVRMRINRLKRKRIIGRTRPCPK